MIEINLLPKEYLKGSRGLSFSKAGKYVVAGVGVLILVLVSITFYQVSKINQLEENTAKARRRATALRQDIRMVDALIDVKGKITRRMSTVDKLDRHRSVWVRVLEDVGRNVPEFVWLKKFSDLKEQSSNNQEQDDSTATNDATEDIRPISIEGYAFTLNALAAYMIKMMRSDYFDKVELVSATEVAFDEDGRVLLGSEKDDSEQKAYSFTMTCNLHYLSDEELRNLIAATAGATDSKHRQLN